jgi:sugar O-acyltransferase (sialic acid O-acetyltransferase NeuD family)
MTKRIGIFGNSGMAREARDIAELMGLRTTFIISEAKERENFAGDEEIMLESDINLYSDMLYIVGIGDCAVRKAIVKRYENKITFCNLIHPSATFGQSQRIEIEGRRGVIICAGVRFTSNVKIGDFTIFNLNATISHDSIICDYTTVSPQACILGNIEIKSGVWIGAGAIINQGSVGKRRLIGQNTIIGSGAVVTKDCQANSVYVGVPARKIK